jgi:GSCFA family
MQLFRTPLKEKPQMRLIQYSDALFAIGSCFSEHMSERLLRAGFDITQSPFGTVYNPVSIKEQVLRLCGGGKFAEGELIQTNELWHTWQHHGEWSGTDKTEVLAHMNSAFWGAFGKFSHAQQLMLTVGAAHVYTHVETGQIVANCHKAPASMFTKRRLTVQECIDALREAIVAARRINPDIQVLLTVSPVKHLRDGMSENLLSKSTLLLACNEVAATIPNVVYLPVYELVTEELRDYRFYAADMCHPSEQAIEYVWDWFFAHCLSTEAQSLAKEGLRLQKALEHRPLHPDTEAHRRFLEQLERDLAAWRAKSGRQVSSIPDMLF